MQTVQQIDQAITANRRELKRRERFDRLSPEGWQAAWDKHPYLAWADRALLVERSLAREAA